MLVSRCQHASFPDQLLNRGNIVETNDRYLSGLAGLRYSSYGAQRHVVVRRKYRSKIRVLHEHARRDVNGGRLVPLRALLRDNFQARVFNRFLKTGCSLLGVIGGWHTLQDGNFLARAHALRDVTPYQFGANKVVRSDERYLEAVLAENV